MDTSPMINFILGIFTGIGIAILLGHYLNNQRKKEQQRIIDDLKKIWSGFRISPDDLEYLNSSHTPYPLSMAHAKDLKAQLKDAIDREDFKEAARLRDLINGK